MKSGKITLIIVPILLTACHQDNTLYRDVYNSQRDCMQDWNSELCEAEDSSTSSYAYYIHRYLGPQYYRKNRQVKMNLSGRKIKAKGNHSTKQPLISQSIDRLAKSTPIRGGFGRASSSFGG
ncbi:hypothetical protein F4V57_06025 [Acinetobacter qingfengensis]|uniref:DUF1190 domain-containing protein n=1 Tax=Acinetobacter qingfengensis TaxID=1262585 RepID=A0A1E7RDR6_9GAMM|nr:hypothetical protein [Acinetobacter qingfengensis]KAA8734513.1 hypothetical protein F4V57_06025 [Acinetobacter qingfengensis]OEY97550.1 hypothetical protein BJI46_09355 [Acinetobacter qingfengensis]